MPRVKGPLFSAEASGTFNGLVQYRMVRGKAVATKARKKAEVLSEAQKVQNVRFKAATSAWKDLAESQKNMWRNAGEDQDMVGYRLYVREYLAQEIVYPNQPTVPA